ncbi:hypothetical protein ACIGFK_36115 [Streptomyces sp. NPDC085524]|uniref:hypothetical protein n=1 Tax=unclassified Streptomyces TaxID=2593676 RepID=UPI0035E0FED4
MRRIAVSSVVVAGLSGLLAWGPVAPAGAWGGPEADVSYHGRVVLSGEQLRIWLVPENDGPAAVPNATLRVRLSADLADRQQLPSGCARAGLREVVCETGPMAVHGSGRHIGMALGLRERASEVVVRVDTWWNGGATDRDSAGGEHVVLALDTGDAYAF